jgi:hypothetical protein
MQPRARTIWQRQDLNQTPVARLAQVCFPHSELRTWPLDNKLDPGSVLWIPISEQATATYVDFLVTRPGLQELEIQNFTPALPEPIAHWLLPSHENFLAVARHDQLPEPVVRMVREAVAKLPAEPSRDSRLGPGARLNLTTDVIASAIAIVETAFPCTV